MGCDRAGAHDVRRRDRDRRGEGGGRRLRDPCVHRDSIRTRWRGGGDDTTGADGAVRNDSRSLEEQLVGGKNYQFPWYQGIGVELINKLIFEKAGLKPADFPKEVSGLKDLCQTLKTKAGTVCDVRLPVSDLLAQMVDAGGVKVISDDGKKFTFDSPEGVAWLQMYVDMVKAGTVDNAALTGDDPFGLLLFSAGQAPFYTVVPILIFFIAVQRYFVRGLTGAVKG
jgi:extracellular solute-binding protein